MQSYQITQIVVRTVTFVTFIGLMVAETIGGSVCPKGTGDIIQQYETPITPAAYSFVLWSVIYILQAFFALWAVIPLENDRTVITVCPPIVIAWWFEIAWIFAIDCEHMVFEACAIIGALIFFAVAFVVAYLRLPTFDKAMSLARRRVRPENLDEAAPLMKSEHEWQVEGEEAAIESAIFSKQWMIYRPPQSQSRVMTEVLVMWLPTSINTAWLLLYAPLSVLIAIEQTHGGIVVSNGWGIAIVIVITIVGVAIGGLLRDFVFPMTLLWAMIAIAIGASHALRESHTSVVITASIMAAMLALVTAVVLYSRSRQLLQLWNVRQQALNEGTY